jgi:hypothetical protein
MEIERRLVFGLASPLEARSRGGLFVRGFLPPSAFGHAGATIPLRPSAQKGSSEKSGCQIGRGLFTIPDLYAAPQYVVPTRVARGGPGAIFAALVAFYARSCMRTSENASLETVRKGVLRG